MKPLSSVKQTATRNTKATREENMSLKTKQFMVSALSKHLSLDPETYLSDIGESDDVKALCSKVLKSPPKEEVMKWIEFADKFPVDSKGRFDALSGLNEELLTKSVLLGNGLTPTEADVIVFAAIYASVIDLQTQHREQLPNLLRWMDYIQHKKEFGQPFEKIVLERPSFQSQSSSVSVASKQEGSNAKKASQDAKIAEKVSQNTKVAEKSAAVKDTKKTDPAKKATGAKESTQEKKKPEETGASGKDEVSVSLLNIQVGHIRKAWKHPSADSLLVEEIDVGEAKLRQVVSGLAKFCTPEELTNRSVVLITNVKPGKLRDVMSEGLVLCASNEDHTVVEPLLPPEGAKIGERVTFAGVDGKPEDVLNPKKKQLEKITPHLFTDEEGVATFKGIPFMTSGGPCKSSIPKATIK